MKKTTSLFLACTSLFFASQLISCKKDEKKEPKTMVGTWTTTTLSWKETTNGVVTADTSINITGLLSITFNADNSYKRLTPLAPSEVENGTYETSGSRLILKYTEDGVSYSDTSNYEFSEDTFIMKETTTDIYDTETVVTEDRTTFKRN